MSVCTVAGSGEKSQENFISTQVDKIHQTRVSP